MNIFWNIIYCFPSNNCTLNLDLTWEQWSVKPLPTFLLYASNIFLCKYWKEFEKDIDAAYRICFSGMLTRVSPLLYITHLNRWITIRNWMSYLFFQSYLYLLKIRKLSVCSAVKCSLESPIFYLFLYVEDFILLSTLSNAHIAIKTLNGPKKYLRWKHTRKHCKSIYFILHT